MTWLKRIGIAISVIVALLAAFVGASWLTYRNDMRIDTANGINESGYVKIGGIDQWIQIRGRDRNNPVLLYLNGGPGFSQVPNTHRFRSWEKDFTVVMWDPRGQNKTFARSGTNVAPMTIAQMTADGLEVAGYLRTHLHKDKIILVGHSWGSMLGTHMVHQRPDFFSVYVGTGQVTNLAKQEAFAYPLLVERARKLGNKTAEQQLVAVGPPPYPSEGFTKWVSISWANNSDPVPRQSITSLGDFWLGLKLVLRKPGIPPDAAFAQSALWDEMLADDLPALGKFDVPVVFILGREDLVTAEPLAAAYFAALEAPSKKLVVLEGIGHLAVIYQPERFLDQLVREVRPLAVQNGG